MYRPRPIGHAASAESPGGIELRVHGVSGTPPEEMLDRLEVDQTAGDEVAGFFRRRDDDRPDDGSPVLEAYSWGGLTSRSWTRALWVLLMPFALLNVAGWMLPPASSDRDEDESDDPHAGWPHRVASATVRLAGILVTALITVWIAQVTIDTVAYQCGGIAECREGNVVVRALFGHDFMADNSFRRVAVGALIPAAILGLLWWLGAVTRSRYDAFGQAPREKARADAVGSFGDPGFWSDERVLRILSRTHITSGVLIVTTLLALSVQRIDTNAEGPSIAWLVAIGLALGLLVVVAVMATTLEVATHRVSIEARAASESIARRQRLSTTVFWASWGLLAFTALTAWTTTADGASPTGALGTVKRAALHEEGSFDAPAAAMPIILLALEITLVVAIRLHPARAAGARADGPDYLPRPGFWGYGAAVALLLGYGTAAVALLSFSSWIGRLLGGPDVVTYPSVYDAAAVLVLWVAVPVVIYVVWLAVRSSRRAFADAAKNADEGAFAPDFRAPLPFDVQPEEPEATEDPERQNRLLAREAWENVVRRSREHRVLVDQADRILVVLLVALVGVFLLAYVRVGGDERSGHWLLELLPSWMVTAAVWVVAVGIPIALFAVVRESFANKARRRQVGILWDVLTFWPRWFHPLAPPNYSARAVPELQTRLDRLTSQGDDVVVCAHSQGTLVALAAIDGLRGVPRHCDRPRGSDGSGEDRRDAAPDAAARPAGSGILEHVALLTYGSPITRLYAKYFPAYTGQSIRRVTAALDDGDRMRWCNLYRATDLIGGAIVPELGPADPRTRLHRAPDLVPGCDPGVPLADPDLARVALPFPPLGERHPAPAGHSGYEKATQYRDARNALFARIHGNPEPELGSGS